MHWTVQPWHEGLSREDRKGQAMGNWREERESRPTGRVWVGCPVGLVLAMTGRPYLLRDCPPLDCPERARPDPEGVTEQPSSNPG